MYEALIDSIATGFASGFIGGLCCVGAFYYHLRGIYLEYIEARENVHDVIDYKKLEKEIKDLSKRVKELNLEVYYSETDK